MLYYYIYQCLCDVYPTVAHFSTHPQLMERKKVKPLYSVYSLTVMKQTRPYKQTKISVVYLYIILKMVLFNNK